MTFIVNILLYYWNANWIRTNIYPNSRCRILPLKLQHSLIIAPLYLRTVQCWLRVCPSKLHHIHRYIDVSYSSTINSRNRDDLRTCAFGGIEPTITLYKPLCSFTRVITTRLSKDRTHYPAVLPIYTLNRHLNFISKGFN